jgi:hypothetical protein
METTDDSGGPAPMLPAGMAKRPLSGWSIAALVAAVLFLPLLPILLGIIALVKIHHSGGRSGGMVLAIVAIALGVVELIAGVLASLAVPAFIRARQKAEMTRAMNNTRQISLSLFAFDQDWGEMPSRKIYEANRDQFAEVSEGDDANFYLGMLIAGGYTASEDLFRVKDGNTRSKQHEGMGNEPRKVLEDGECGFGYVMLECDRALTMSEAGRPVLLAPVVPGSGGRNPQFDPKIWEGRGLFSRLDGSVQSERIERGVLMVKQPGGAKSLFATGPGTLWESELPEVKAPR